VAAPMRDEEDVAALAEELSQLGLPAWLLLAPVVVKNRAEWTATRRGIDEPAKLEFAAGERDFLRLGGGGRRGGKEREERNEVSHLARVNRRYAFCFSASSFWSSPDWYISRMMSEPPTNSPLT